MRDIFTLVKNKANDQSSYNIKKKTMKTLGISPKKFLNFKIPLPPSKPVPKLIKKKEVRPQW